MEADLVHRELTMALNSKHHICQGLPTKGTRQCTLKDRDNQAGLVTQLGILLQLKAASYLSSIKSEKSSIII